MFKHKVVSECDTIFPKNTVLIQITLNSWWHKNKLATGIPTNTVLNKNVALSIRLLLRNAK